MSHEEVETVIDTELEQLQGWCTPTKAKRMAALARGASLCVELGVFGGRSLVAMSLTLRDQGFGRADGIDPFTAAAALEGSNAPENDEWWAKLDYEAIARSAQEAIYKLKLIPFTHLIRMRSSDAVSFYEDGSIDVLHQDSNHSEEVSCAEVARWAPKIRPGGFWIFDDAHWPSTQKAQRALNDFGFREFENHIEWKIYRKAGV